MKFADVIGQEHITEVLSGEIKTGSVSHAYLFCGSRGTGKTTCAKIFARAVNCENPKDGDPCGERVLELYGTIASETCGQPSNRFHQMIPVLSHLDVRNFSIKYFLASAWEI